MLRALRPFVVFVLLTWALCSVSRATPTAGFALEMDVASDRATSLQLFFDNGQFWSAHDSIRIDVPAGAELRPIRFVLPAEPIKRLRLDPSDGEVALRLGHVRLLTAEGAVVREISASAVRPIWQVQAIRVEEGIATIHTQPHADDPKLLIDEPLHEETIRRLERSTVTRASLLAFAVVVAGALGFVVFTVVRIVLRPAAESLTSRPMLVAAFIGTFLVVAGERLAWLRTHATSVPFWDEWASDWLNLLTPLQGGFLDWNALFIPQSEHRIVLTRLLTLVTSTLSGEWDPRIGMTASALLWGLSLAIVAAMILRAHRWIGFLAVVALAALAAQPFDVVNVFWGGQSQMFALVLLMVACFVLASAPNPTPLTILASALAAVSSLGTMGTGFLAPGIAAVICAARLVGERAPRRTLVVMMLTFLVIAALGFHWRAEARFVGPQYASSFGQFWRALTGFGSWPIPAGTATWLLRNLPWFAQCITVLLRRRGSALDWFAIAIGAWAFAGDCGLAYARPWMSPPTDTRHFSPLFVGLIAAVVNAVALISGSAQRWKRARVAIALIAAVPVIAMIPICARGIKGTQEQPYWVKAHEDNVYPFLATGDFSLMQDLPPDGRSPYWNSTDLAVLLNDRHLWPVFPSELRKRIAARPGAPYALADVHAGWVTLSARTLMKLGIVFAVLGTLLLLTIPFLKLRATSEPLGVQR